AEMFKDRPWTRAGLKELGGMLGVGAAFLDATIGSQARHPVLRRHGEAARAILRALLPPAGSSIRGRMRSSAELMAASGYAGRTAEFRELLQVLDSEVRLITPVEIPAGEPAPAVAPATAASPAPAVMPEPDRNTTADGPASEYQLTHDYLVPSIRDW